MNGWIYFLVIAFCTYIFTWLIERFFPASSDYQDIKTNTLNEKIEYIKRKFEYQRKNPNLSVVLFGYLFSILIYIYFIMNSNYPIIGAVIIGLLASYCLIWFHKIDESRAFLNYCLSFFFIFSLILIQKYSPLLIFGYKINIWMVAPFFFLINLLIRGKKKWSK